MLVFMFSCWWSSPNYKVLFPTYIINRIFFKNLHEWILPAKLAAWLEGSVGPLLWFSLGRIKHFSLCWRSGEYPTCFYHFRSQLFMCSYLELKQQHSLSTLVLKCTRELKRLNLTFSFSSPSGSSKAASCSFLLRYFRKADMNAHGYRVWIKVKWKEKAELESNFLNTVFPSCISVWVSKQFVR